MRRDEYLKANIMNREDLHKVSEIQQIIDKHKSEQGELISILEEIQAKYSYLPQGALKVLADQTGRSLVDIYGVATFYRAFSLKPRGRHLTSICLGTACHVRNAPLLVEEFERQLGIKAGNTTPDREITLETVKCLGACALGPIVVSDGRYFANVGTSKVKSIIKKTRQGEDKIDVKQDPRIFPVEVSCARCNHSMMDSSYLIEGYPSIRVTISVEQDHGWLRLSSLYGSYTVETDVEIPMDAVVNFFCPHCNSELMGGINCADCAAPMVPMIVRGGGIIQICSRRGCKSHMLDLDGANF
jgi:NADH:ubiquinone oxidoreductase subunit E